MAWATDRTMQHTERPAMRSPGRPAPPREVEREFWRLIATGASSEDAATAVGVSAPVGSRWFRHGGGMPSMTLVEPTGRYLSFAEREELGLLKAQDHGVREIGRRMGRAPSTISRELRRNAATDLMVVNPRASAKDAIRFTPSRRRFPYGPQAAVLTGIPRIQVDAARHQSGRTRKET